jgi:hypothetical protein
VRKRDRERAAKRRRKAILTEVGRVADLPRAHSDLRASIQDAHGVNTRRAMYLVAVMALALRKLEEFPEWWDTAISGRERS